MPVASGGIHVWHMPALVEIFGDDAYLQFGAGTLSNRSRYMNRLVDCRVWVGGTRRARQVKWLRSVHNHETAFAGLLSNLCSAQRINVNQIPSMHQHKASGSRPTMEPPCPSWDAARRGIGASPSSCGETCSPRCALQLSFLELGLVQIPLEAIDSCVTKAHQSSFAMFH